MFSLQMTLVLAVTVIIIPMFAPYNLRSGAAVTACCWARAGCNFGKRDVVCPRGLPADGSGGGMAVGSGDPD